MRALVTTDPFITGLCVTSVDSGLWEELNVCPICGRSDYLRDIGSIEGKTPGTIAAVCLDCEHGFLRRRPVKTWYDQFYSKEWDQEGQARLTKSSESTEPARLSRPFNFCVTHLPPNSNVLDVGAGFGGLLLPFRDHGHNVYGLERSTHRAQYLQEGLGIPSFNLPLESFQPSSKLQLVCMHHVLEHVSDPVEVIGRIAGMLAEGGLFYIAVPDYWRGEYPPQAFHFVPHLSWFTFKSLFRVLAKSGFEVLKKEERKEIQVLAVKSNGANSGPDPMASGAVSRAAFWDNTVRSVIQAFGGRNGDHTLVWFVDDNQPKWFYQRRVLRGSRLAPAMIKTSIRLERSLPGRLRGWLRGVVPSFVASEAPRMLTVDLQGDASLPVTVQYSSHAAPVWVK